jgi:hypothetical protein
MLSPWLKATTPSENAPKMAMANHIKFLLILFTENSSPVDLLKLTKF